MPYQRKNKKTERKKVSQQRTLCINNGGQSTKDKTNTNKINRRPRENLGFKSPKDIFFSLVTRFVAFVG